MAGAGSSAGGCEEEGTVRCPQEGSSELAICKKALSFVCKDTSQASALVRKAIGALTTAQPFLQNATTLSSLLSSFGKCKEEVKKKRRRNH